VAGEISRNRVVVIKNVLLILWIAVLGLASTAALEGTFSKVFSSVSQGLGERGVKLAQKLPGVEGTEN